jgi:hypothetical protein
MAKLARRRGSGGFISLTHVVFFSFLFFWRIGPAAPYNILSMVPYASCCFGINPLV